MHGSKFLGRSLGFAAAAAVVLLASQFALAQAYTFGVISDTQDTIGTGVNTVSTNIITAVNQRFVSAGVSFVLQPGDLCDNGSVAGLTTRITTANSLLTAANIPFYGLRGNHEDTGSPAANYFQANYIPAGAEIAPDGLSYAITVNNTKFVMLDIVTADSTTAMDSATTWMNGVLGENDHTQAFVLQHKNLIGQNHHDTAFETGSNMDANPVQQNNFFAALATHNVKYDISGHDHMNHRSVVTSPNGQYQVQEIISQSDSTKYYTPAAPYDSRETSVSDQQNMIGYYLYTVDGPKVTGQYWATPPAGNGDITANPVWVLQDTFGYSLNGKQFTIARGASYTSVSDQIAAGAGFRGTSMAIIGGTNTTTGTAGGAGAEADDLNTGWAAKTAGLASDILTLWGMQNALGSSATDPFAVSMSFSTSDALDGGTVYMVTKDAGGNWVRAGTNFILGDYDSSDAVGTYGVDPSNNTAWAVVNVAGDFAVVPEPVTMSLLVIGGLAGLLRRKRQ